MFEVIFYKIDSIKWTGVSDMNTDDQNIRKKLRHEYEVEPQVLVTHKSKSY